MCCNVIVLFFFREVLSLYFTEIYLMPETAELARVNSVLKEYRTPRR